MLILLRLGRWELSISREDRDPGGTTPAPVDAPQPMEVWTPEHVGFLPPAYPDPSEGQ